MTAAIRSTTGLIKERAASSRSERPAVVAVGFVAAVTVKSMMPRPLAAGWKSSMKGVVMFLTMKLHSTQHTCRTASIQQCWLDVPSAHMLA